MTNTPTETDTGVIASGLMKLLADGMMFALRSRTLRMRACSLGLSIPAEVWDISDIDQICEHTAAAIGRAGEVIPFDSTDLLAMSSFQNIPLSNARLDTEKAILDQHKADRRLVIQNGLFLFQIFDQLDQAPAKAIVEQLVKQHVAKLPGHEFLELRT